jgi:cyclophilin family peptidyl-prolyl cis-trans isomerase
MPTLPNGTTTLLPTGNYKAGTFTSPVYDLQVNQSQVSVAADRNNWPDTGSDVVSVVVSLSFDNWTTQQVLAGFTAPGGNLTDPWGGSGAQSWFSVEIPQPENPNRQVKADVTTYARINTAVHVTVS